MKTSKKSLSQLLLFFIGSLLGSLLLNSNNATAGSPNNVFVSIPPQKWICDTISENKITTQVLIDKGQDPHTYEPSPRQIMQLTQAELYLRIELPFEQQILKVIHSNSKKIKIVDITTGSKKISPKAHEDQADAHNEEKAGAHDHDDHSGLDPHIWLSPINLNIIIANTAHELAAIDPPNRILYSTNAKKLMAQVSELHEQLTAQLAPYRGASFYVFHPAFGYFAQAYGLHQKAVEVEGKSPTPKQLSRIITEAQKNNVKIMFVQPQFDAKSAQAVASAISGKIIQLDPMAADCIKNLTYMGNAIAKTMNQ